MANPVLPEGGNVLLEPVKKENKIGRFYLQSDLRGGILTKGRVLAIGPWIESQTYKVGDVVVLKSYTGSPVQHDGKQFLIVPDAELLYVEG